LRSTLAPSRFPLAPSDFPRVRAALPASSEPDHEREEARRQAEAKLAELEILHQNRLKTVWEPDKRQEAEEEYVRERRRIEGERDKKLEKLRG